MKKTKDDNERIALHRTTITVTLRCTLKCKLCSADVINYEHPPHYSADFIAKELAHYFEIVDFVEWLQYSGGEPFLNRELPQMVEEAMKYCNRFDKLMIFANGTLLPDEKMIEVFYKYRDKIHFFFSNYGKISHHAKELMDCFIKNELSFSEKKYYGENQHCDGWVDFGGWECRGYTEEQLCSIYDKCSMHTMGFSVVQEGQMHLCRKSYRGMELGAVARASSDFMDILSPDSTIEEKRKHLKKMLSLPYLQACAYCNATYGISDKKKRFQPAEQLS